MQTICLCGSKTQTYCVYKNTNFFRESQCQRQLSTRAMRQPCKKQTYQLLRKTQAVQELPFYEVIGCLWWLAQMTRLDIFVALQRASHWVSKPSFKLWRWLVRILKYLSGTRSLGLTFRKVKGAPPLCAYVDAAFADNENRRSTAGWVFFVHGNVTAYDSHTIKRVVTSTEAECSALTIVEREPVAAANVRSTDWDLY